MNRELETANIRNILGFNVKTKTSVGAAVWTSVTLSLIYIYDISLSSFSEEAVKSTIPKNVILMILGFFFCCLLFPYFLSFSFLSLVFIPGCLCIIVCLVMVVFCYDFVIIWKCPSSQVQH